MKTITIVGTQWGDEGKGKLTDILAAEADLVVRYQGGNNAGHTIVFGGRKYALHLIPSGVFHPNTKNVLAPGMVIDPIALADEIKKLELAGVDTSNVVVSDRSHVVLAPHIALDEAIENARADKVGTTGKGIGPAYALKATRTGIRMVDFIDEAQFKTALIAHLSVVNPMLKAFGAQAQSAERIVRDTAEARKVIAKRVKNASVLINQALENKKRVLFEGAQGTMLCLDHGTYPYVTSSSPTAAGVPLGAGVPPQAIKTVLGITKAYTTRVGEGHLPTEIKGELADDIRTRGNEFGTTTGRPRRVGWLDAVVLKHAKRISGITHLAVMLLDVLRGVHPLTICVGYRLNGEIIDWIPASAQDLARCEPVTITMNGFDEPLEGIERFEDLPKNAQAYVNKVAELTGTKVAFVSVGPDRNQTLRLIDNLWEENNG